jgi:Winged helix DNA-binding domain
MKQGCAIERQQAVRSRREAATACGSSSPGLTVWARVEDIDRLAVRRALWEDRTLIKTWAMRGTLHLLPADDFSLWQAALGTSRRYRKPGLWRRFPLTLDELDRLTQAIGAALDGRVMTREELAQEVTRLTRSDALGAKVAYGSWGTILKPAAFAGRLCFAPSDGQRVRFTHPNSWLARPRPPVDPETAPAVVTRRFLSAYGPATCHELARWWGGCFVSTARKWITSLGEEVAEVDLDGTQAWMLAADARELRELPPNRSARLLPAFDQYVIGASGHAEHLLPGDLRHRVYRPQGWISPVLLVNGRMHGTWRHDIKGSRVEVVIRPFVEAPVWVAARPRTKRSAWPRSSAAHCA